DVPAAPQLVRQPLDRVEPVAGLVGGVLVQRDAARRARPTDVEPAQGEAAGREPLATRRIGVPTPVVLAVRDHLEDGRELRRIASAIRAAHERTPDVGRQLRPVADDDPRVPVNLHVEPRLRRRPGVRHLATTATIGGTSARAYGRAGARRRARSDRATMPRWRVASSATTDGWRMRTPGSPCGTTTGHDRTAALASMASSISRTSPRA